MSVPFPCDFFAWKNWCGSSLVKELVWSVGHAWSSKNGEVFQKTGGIPPPPYMLYVLYVLYVLCGEKIKSRNLSKNKNI